MTEFGRSGVIAWYLVAAGRRGRGCASSEVVTSRSAGWRLAATLVAAATALAACGAGSDDEVDGESDGIATPTSVPDDDPPVSTVPGERIAGDEEQESAEVEVPLTLRSTATSADGELILTVVSNAAQLWALEPGERCDPPGPAVALFEAIVVGDEVTTMTAEPWADDVDADGLGFAVDDGGIWRAVIGPFDPSDVGESVEVTVAASTDSGAELTTELVLSVLSPEPCTDTTTSDVDREPDLLALTVASSPDDGVIVGLGRTDCEERPTSLVVDAEFDDSAIALLADITLPDGTIVKRSSDARTFRAASFSVGPFASPTSGDEPSTTVVIRAIDSYGGTETRSVSGTLVEPTPCQPATTVVSATTAAPVTAAPTTAAPQPDVFSVSLDPASPAVTASGGGFCATGATTFAVEVVAPPDVTSVTIIGVTADGVNHGANGVTSSVSSSVAGTLWRATMGPFPAWAAMPERSAISIQVTVSNGRTSRTASASATLRRPNPCATTTVAPTTAPPTTAPPTTVAPPTTITTTTTASTTTTTP